MVTPVNRRMALFWASVMMASSFCSMERSWKSYLSRMISLRTYIESRTNYLVQGDLQVAEKLRAVIIHLLDYLESPLHPVDCRFAVWIDLQAGLIVLVLHALAVLDHALEHVQLLARDRLDRGQLVDGPEVRSDELDGLILLPRRISPSFLGMVSFGGRVGI